MMKCEEEIMLEISKITKKNIHDVVAALQTNSPTDTQMPFIVSLFDYLDKNSGFMKAILGPKGDLSFQARLRDFMWKTFFGDNPDALFKEKNLFVLGHYLAAYVVSNFKKTSQYLLTGLIW